jgi:hypothetical protein
MCPDEEHRLDHYLGKSGRQRIFERIAVPIFTLRGRRSQATGR